MASRSKPLFAFTLLEIVLVMAILAIVGGVVGWQIQGLVSSYRFQSDVEELYSTLKKAQALSLTYQTDIELSLFQERGEWKYRLFTHEPFPKALFESRTKTLHGVRQVKFNNRSLHQSTTWTLFSRGSIDPRGIFCFLPAPLEDDQENSALEQALWIDCQAAFLIKLSHIKPRTIELQTSIPQTT